MRKTWFILAASLGFALSASAAPALQTLAAAARPNAATVAALAQSISAAVDASRDTAMASGATGADIERAVTGALEQEIIASGGDPGLVLEGLRLTLSLQRCVLTDRETGIWNRPGCLAISDVLAAVEASLGGPAATGPTGNVAGVAAGAPPQTLSGSDYAPG